MININIQISEEQLESFIDNSIQNGDYSTMVTYNDGDVIIEKENISKEQYFTNRIARWVNEITVMHEKAKAERIAAESLSNLRTLVLIDQPVITQEEIDLARRERGEQTEELTETQTKTI